MQIRSLLAGAGLAVVVAAVPVTVLSVANADEGTSTGTTTSTSCPRQDLHQEVADYLAAHPEVAEELATLRALPAGERAEARRAYLAENPDVAAAVQQLRADRRSTWWEVAGNTSAALAEHPAVADLFDSLADVPAGERAEAAQQYLADHPEARADLQDLRHDVQEHRQQCRAGS